MGLSLVPGFLYRARGAHASREPATFLPCRALARRRNGCFRPLADKSDMPGGMGRQGLRATTRKGPANAECLSREIFSIISDDGFANAEKCR